VGKGAIIALLILLLIAASAIMILQFSNPPVKPKEEIPERKSQ